MIGDGSLTVLLSSSFFSLVHPLQCAVSLCIVSYLLVVMALLLASVLFGHGSFILFHTGVDRCFCWRPLSFIAAAAPACSCSLSCHISHWLALFICYQLASSCDHRVRRWTPSRRVLPCSTRSNKRAFNRQGADIWVWSGLVTASLASISWFIIV